MTVVRAKRLGWDETTDVVGNDILDPYDYTDDDLEGELETIRVHTDVLDYTNYIVAGQVADPATIQPVVAGEHAAVNGHA